MMIRPMVSSATEWWFVPGALQTLIPCAAAAWMSMESYPTPLRAMTFREAAPVSMSAVTGSLARIAPDMPSNNERRSSRVRGHREGE
ncbi:hypothetical protein SRABI83_04385 [Arthrobacter sp. Bi83]|nr:hypothetical protein SRABI83_04385 [Arthrobacter sp. Bi83]